MSAYKCDTERVSDPYGSEYDELVHQIVKIFGHNWKLDKHMDVHAKGSCWGGLGTFCFEQVQGKLDWHFVGIPVNKRG